MFISTLEPASQSNAYASNIGQGVAGKQQYLVVCPVYHTMIVLESPPMVAT
jgi:hypothetical protein